MALIAITMVLSIPSAASAATVQNGVVSAHGWNSCSKGWYKVTGTFKNYCPVCHSYGTLRFNPKGTYEGEWTCSHCDSDYCLCGRCKASGSHIYLVPAKLVVGKKLDTPSNTPTNTAQDTKDTGKSTLKTITQRLNQDWSTF